MAGDATEERAVILEIQRMSTEDGPGLRTTVFFKGCSLNCAWCHNPESILTKPQIQWIESRCIGCKLCIETCEHQALSTGPDGIIIDRERCTGCGACVEECPSTAMELLGRSWSVEALCAELIKDRVFFEKSDRGGVTLSGGEVALQAPFAAELLKRIKDQGLHTAIDTCGEVRAETLEILLPHADLVLFDIKGIACEDHRHWCGSGNERILKNAAHICDYINKHETPAELWIRTPVIPGATDSEACIRGIGRFIAEKLNGVARWELCAFNNLCRDKYKRLDLDWRFDQSELMCRTAMEELAEAARDSGVDPSIVHWSGPTMLETGEAPENPPDLRMVVGGGIK